MKWQELFDRCWNSDLQAQVLVRDYITHPDKLDTLDRVAYYDRSTAETIQRMQEYIEALSGYRQALAERYAALATMPYTLRLDLIRNKGYFDKKVTYTLRLVRVYEDGHEQNEQETVYPGTQRRDAIRAFEDMQRERPGILCKMDISKKSWEK